MDAIEPILPKHSILPEVRATERSDRVHRDGHQSGGHGEQRRRRNDEEAVEVDVESVEATDDEVDADGTVTVLELPSPRLVDLTADGDPEPSPPRRIDVTDDDDGDPPAHRIDLSV